MSRHRLFVGAASAMMLLVPVLVNEFGHPPQSWADSPPKGQWTSIGPNRVTGPPVALGDGSTFGPYDAVGRLTAIAVNPVDPDIIYAGSAGQLGHEGSGVWKTTDGGASWASVTDGFLETLSIGAIAIDPSNASHVYTITSDEGLWHSTNAGSTWSRLGAETFPIRSNTDTGDWAVLLIDPVDTDVMWLTSDDGVLRSDDGGSTWTPSLDAAAATSLVMDPLDHDVLYAALRGKGVYKTTDGGAIWTAQDATTPATLPFGAVTMDRGVLLAISHPAAATSETVYAIFPRWGSYGIDWDLYRTDDGTTWHLPSSPCVNGLPLTSYRCFVTILASDPAETDQVYVGGGPLWVSSNGGQTFTVVPLAWNDRQPASPHGDYWELVTDPTNHKVLFVGTDGGIYRSSNHGIEGSWTFIGEGISNAEMYDIALASTVDRAISGTQDNGNILYTGNLVWDHRPLDAIYGGDGGAVAVDPTDPSRLYAGFNNDGAPSASTDGGATFSAFVSGFAGYTDCHAYNMTLDLQVDPNDPKVLLESCGFSLWRATTTGPISGWNWSSIFTTSGQYVTRSAVQDDLDVYYAGTTKGRVFASLGGTVWSATPVFTDPESKFVSDLEVDPLHQELLYASFAPVTTVDRDCDTNAGTARIYQLARQTTVPVTLNALDITDNLPVGLCVNALAIDPVVDRTVYAGTNKGVYRGRASSAGGPWTWEEYNDGMPLADVRDLAVHPVNGHIFAATFGRGAYEVTPETNSPPVLTVPGPQTVDYHDYLTFQVSAIDADAGDPLSFSSSGLPAGLTLTDYGNGTAIVSGLVEAVPAIYTATISVSDGTNPPVSATVQIRVTKEQTLTHYTGPTVIANGQPVTLTAQLLEDDPTQVPNRTLTLSVGNQSCTGLTDLTGVASCVITTVSSPLGPVTVTADFAGDAWYLPSSDSISAIVFAFPERGAFVLGDATIDAAGPTTTLTFWNARWNRLNALTGGELPPAFKGFAAAPSSAPPACGASWTTMTGNSSKPVATVPSYMGVAVASKVTRSDSTVSGDIVQIVVIKTDDGYAPDPGVAGIGTLVATYCSLP